MGGRRCCGGRRPLFPPGGGGSSGCAAQSKDVGRMGLVGIDKHSRGAAGSAQTESLTM